MAYSERSEGVGGRALAASIALGLHAVVGAVLLTALTVTFNPVRHGAVNGIALPPAGAGVAETFNPVSKGSPGHLIKHAWMPATQRDFALGRLHGSAWAHADESRQLLRCGWRQSCLLWRLGPPIPVVHPMRWLAPNELAMARRLEPDDWVAYSLRVAADGRVGTCQIERPSRDQQFDAALCRAIRSRGRFLPAIDISGSRVPDTFRGIVHSLRDSPAAASGTRLIGADP